MFVSLFQKLNNYTYSVGNDNKWTERNWIPTFVLICVFLGVHFFCLYRLCREKVSASQRPSHLLIFRSPVTKPTPFLGLFLTFICVDKKRADPSIDSLCFLLNFVLPSKNRGSEGATDSLQWTCTEVKSFLWWLQAANEGSEHRAAYCRCARQLPKPIETHLGQRS